MTPPSSRRTGVLAVAVSAAVLVPTVTASTPAAAATPTVSCTSAKPSLAAKLKKDITAALANRATLSAGPADGRAVRPCYLRVDVRSLALRG